MGAVVRSCAHGSEHPFSPLVSDDLADTLNAKTLPIPTEQRLDVFVCPGVPEEALRRWETQGGQSTFHHPDLFMEAEDLGKDKAKTCGMVLFAATGPGGMLGKRLSTLLAPFYERAGTETNAFQYQPIERNFVRRGPDWFNERKTT